MNTSYQKFSLIDGGIPGYITSREASRINEAYARFCDAELILKESNVYVQCDRMRLFESFLAEEDVDNIPGDRSLSEVLGSLKKAASAAGGAIKKGAEKVASSRAARAVSKIAGAASSAVGKGLKAASRTAFSDVSLEKGGSLLGLGKKSKMQQKEYQDMLTDPGPAGDTVWAIKDKVSKNYPNMKDAEQFKKETIEASKVVQSLIQKNPGDEYEISNAWNKWLTYVLDQQLGDAWKHQMESREHFRNRVLIEAGLADKVKGLGKSAVEKIKSAGKKVKDEFTTDYSEGGLGTSETMKGLNSQLASVILGMVGAGGLSMGGLILQGNPGILDALKGKEAIQVLEKESVSTEEVSELIDKEIPPIQVKSRFVKDAIKELAEKSSNGEVKLETAEDYKKFMENYDGGASKLFSDLGVGGKPGEGGKTAKSLASSVMSKLESGKTPDEAFGATTSGGLSPVAKQMAKEMGIPEKEFAAATSDVKHPVWKSIPKEAYKDPSHPVWKTVKTSKFAKELAKEIGVPEKVLGDIDYSETPSTSGLERMGGAAGIAVSISGMVAKVIVKSQVRKTIVSTIVSGASSAAGVTLGATAAAAATGVGVGAILAGYAIGKLRQHSLDPKYSRAAFLNDLRLDLQKAKQSATSSVVSSARDMKTKRREVASYPAMLKALETLKLDQNASSKDIKVAYNRLRDKYKSEGEEGKMELDMVNQAYDLLTSFGNKGEEGLGSAYSRAEISPDQDLSRSAVKELENLMIQQIGNPPKEPNYKSMGASQRGPAKAKFEKEMEEYQQKKNKFEEEIKKSKDKDARELIKLARWQQQQGRQDTLRLGKFGGTGIIW
jgi:hypothetical protein